MPAFFQYAYSLYGMGLINFSTSRFESGNFVSKNSSYNFHIRKNEDSMRAHVASKTECDDDEMKDIEVDVDVHWNTTKDKHWQLLCNNWWRVFVRPAKCRPVKSQKSLHKYFEQLSADICNCSRKKEEVQTSSCACTHIESNSNP